MATPSYRFFRVSRWIRSPSTSARPSQASLMMVFRRAMSSGARLPSARVMRMLGCGSTTASVLARVARSLARWSR
ncbi:hypothetical protein D3C81_1687370 [compost metagenome]